MNKGTESRDYISALIQQGIRLDGRNLSEYREPRKVEYQISAKSSEGSAKATIGETEVIAGIKMDVVEPYPDSLDEGVLIVNSELLALASPQFESGPPRVDAIELSRVVDRTIRESKVLDTKKLCIEKGKKVWAVFIDIYPINDAGNIFDAAVLASVAALKDAKFPKYDKKEGRVIYELTDKNLPLGDLPTACTLVKINGKVVVDPTNEEEAAMDARLTVALVKDNICAMQKGGDFPLTIKEVGEMVDLAIEKCRELKMVL